MKHAVLNVDRICAKQNSGIGFVTIGGKSRSLDNSTQRYRAGVGRQSQKCCKDGFKSGRPLDIRLHAKRGNQRANHYNCIQNLHHYTVEVFRTGLGPPGAS
ncbi:hypothetical protein C0J52_01271 [Blattella germanica]|nr:hypothetical protein C0J52_01271 [Blattella germanica]